MPILSDRWIREMATTKGMIEPFVERQTREGVISYGLSSYGYDARVGREFEISNTTPLPARIYANEGVCQFLFFKGEQPCEVSYADRKGKYMRQRGVTLPRL